MTKFKVGNKVPISTNLVITGINITKTGSVTYQTDHNFVVQEKILEQMQCCSLAASEDKPEPIKLYCVKDYKPGKFLTKDKIYEIARDGADITYDDGWKWNLVLASSSFNDIKIVPNYLIPLVKRPAKVGEWIVSFDDWITAFGGVPGKPYVMGEHTFVTTGEDMGFYHDCMHNNAFVLDGYQPEPEQYSGKVVCTATNGGAFHTAGKTYLVKNGILLGNNGHAYNRKAYKSLDELKKDAIPNFIEYRGEAQ